MKNTSELVAKGMILITVPAAIKPAHASTPARSPLASISQHMGTMPTTNMMVPQLPIMATVSAPHPGKATSTLSLMGPHVFHWAHYRREKPRLSQKLLKDFIPQIEASRTSQLRISDFIQYFVKKV